ncbi:MAG: hypothetical protein GEU95_13710 [Rhizobiales bacterium]|nr:hypothetical protein [Hyphomicrobiales bacterium]
MAAFFQSLHKTLAAGFGLVVLLIILVGLIGGQFIKFDFDVVAVLLALAALTFQRPYDTIGIGTWLALIMAFNVWFIIWPNQKKILGLIEASADEKGAAARLAGMTSRAITMLPMPMLYCMAAQNNAGL